MKQTAHKGTTAKHAGTHKHTQGKGKHHPAKAKKAQTHHHAAQKQHAHTAAKPATAAKPRKLSPGYDVACCSALAVAESLRRSGRPVGADDVFALYWRTARDPEAGASVLDTLRAAWEFGLAGVRPLRFGRHPLEAHSLGQYVSEPLIDLVGDLGHAEGEQRSVLGFGEPPAIHGASLILGLELPGGPHAVLAETGRWWSWSQPWPPAAFPDAVIEEAWAVVWP